MEYTRLGSTGLKISRLALGCMSYGDPTTPNAHSWALTEDAAGPFFRQADQHLGRARERLLAVMGGEAGPEAELPSSLAAE